MITANTYFDGNVQSLGFTRNGRRQTVGVIAPGEYHFGTQAPERMTVVSGELSIRVDGTTTWVTYPMGTSFEVPGQSGFDVKTAAPSAYLCEFI